MGTVGLRLDADERRVASGLPGHLCAKLLHEADCQVDVRSGDEFAREVQGQSVGQHGAYHEQGGDVLRADVAGQGYFRSLQGASGDTERWKSF